MFDEDKFWPWGENQNREQIPANLENDDENKEQSTKQPIAETNQQDDNNVRPQRTRNKPAWMTGYEVGGNDQSENEEPLTYFDLFSNYDLIRLEDACKDLKWQKAMDVEIAAIEKNNT